ncbi:unnamed protein product [Euphydryas editha]|uniref:Uncharacterized protein n=1 Tax=Euphydryas editha TaxID=104508 RepID=A0AAU9TSS0_EUPED|nr:unnamed protein product [Euphydryas editha]
MNPALECELQNTYHEAKKALQLAISRAKNAGREELLAGVNRDPWRRPYHAARNKLRDQGAPVKETMPPDRDPTLGGVLRMVSDLFLHPAIEPDSSIKSKVSIPLISTGEMGMTLNRLRPRRMAPGLDVERRVLSIAMEHLTGRLRVLFWPLLDTLPRTWQSRRMMNNLSTIRVGIIELPIHNRYIEYSNRVLGRICIMLY